MAHWQEIEIPADVQAALDAARDSIPGAVGLVGIIDTGPAVMVAVSLDLDRHPMVIAAIGRAVEQAGRRLDLLALDRQTWPHGHPCRDCGRLYDEHPVTASVLECRDWR